MSSQCCKAQVHKPSDLEKPHLNMRKGFEAPYLKYPQGDKQRELLPAQP